MMALRGPLILLAIGGGRNDMRAYNVPRTTGSVPHTNYLFIAGVTLRIEEQRRNANYFSIATNILLAADPPNL